MNIPLIRLIALIEEASGVSGYISKRGALHEKCPVREIPYKRNAL